MLRKLSPFATEIAVVLLVKLLLIVAIKLAFFNAPPRPDDQGVAARLLSDAHPAAIPITARNKETQP